LTIPEAIDYFSLPTLSIGNSATIEGSHGQTGSMVFTVSLSEPLNTTFSIDFATANGTAMAQEDFVAASGTLEFAPGETSKDISIEIIGDSLVETNENMFLILSGMSSRIARYANQRATGTINNDDATGLVINDVASIESAGTILFTVSLTNPTTSSVSVRFATGNGTARSGRNADYTAVSGSLNFAPGETSKTISVSIRNDTTIESNEIFFLNLSSAVGAGILDVQGIGTIIDDDGGAQIQSTSDPSTDLLSAWDWDDLIDDSEEKRRKLR